MKSKTTLHQAIESAVNLFNQNNLQGAEEIFRQILASNADNSVAGYYLALIQQRYGKHREAIDLAQGAIRGDQNSRELYMVLASSHQQIGDFAKAEQTCLEAIKKWPDYIDALNGIAFLYAEKKQYDKAEKYLEQALSADSSNSGVWYNYGNYYKQKGDIENAIKAYRKAVSFSKGSERLAVYNNLANVLKLNGEAEDAIALYKEILSVNGNDVVALFNLAGTYYAQRAYGQSLAVIGKLLEIDPDNVGANTLAGQICQEDAENEKAIKYFRRALKSDPKNYKLYEHISRAHIGKGDIGKAIHCSELACDLDKDDFRSRDLMFYLYAATCNFDKLAELRQDLQKAIDLSIADQDIPRIDCFNHLAFTGDFREQAEIAKLWSKDIRANASNMHLEFKHTRRSNKKIVIGYLSSDFGHHAVSYLTHQLFKLHNRDKFVVNAYSLSNKYETDRHHILAKERSDNYVDLVGKSDAEAAQKIFEDEVDILIDLNGHTSGHRLGIAAPRPAPIQISYLGFIGTSGLDFIDYMIIDDIVMTPEQQQIYNEKLIYMPDCYQINGHQYYTINNRFCRADYNLPEDHFVFCSFNQAHKINEEIFTSWLDILKAVPDSCLWIVKFSDLMEKNIRKYTERHGVDPDRVILSKVTTSHDEYMNRISLADLALDTNLFNGGTVTTDTLWQEVPVITLQGESFASRMASSIVTNLGLDELVAKTLDQYKSKAIELALDKPRLDAVKKKLIANKESYPLFNTEHFVSNLEKAYTSIHKNYINGVEVQDIAVGSQQGRP